MPTIEEECGGVMAVIQRKTVDEIIQERESSGNVGENIGRNVGDVSEFKLSERQTIIKNIISSNPTVTAKQMSETLSVTSRTIERDLSAMQKAGIIRHEGKDNAGTWVVLEQKKQKRYER